MLSELKIKNNIIKNLKPIRKNFKNKNNKLSAQGYLDTKKVKIYEIFDVKQGNLREFISNHNQLKKYFPKLITFNNKYIVEEWVKGKTLKEVSQYNLNNTPYSNDVNEIISLMWSIKYKDKVFDYFEHIHNRVGKVNNFNLNKIPIRINHNDLSLDNIVISSDGLKIIDNEFLGCSSGWIFNKINSFLKEDLSDKYFISHDLFSKLWEIRKEWSK
ncbi:hypothetical protein N9K62_02015 [Candidatus Pelagibacter bacterium]|nr:hypothetical protein [Candidatus Pelagibacter bacterium]